MACHAMSRHLMSGHPLPSHAILSHLMPSYPMSSLPHPTECFWSRPDTMVEVVAASERAKIPAGTAVKIPLQVTKSVVPTNSSVCLETARQHDIMTSSHHDIITSSQNHITTPSMSSMSCQKREKYSSTKLIGIRNLASHQLVGSGDRHQSSRPEIGQQQQETNALQLSSEVCSIVLLATRRSNRRSFSALISYHLV